MKHPILSAVFVVILSSVLGGQQARPPGGPTNVQTPSFKVEAEYVEVDVQVTDQKGNFVRELKKEDFEVFEDGKPQTISTFSMVDLPIEQSDRPVLQQPPIASDVQTNEHRFDGRVYVVVFDDLHITFARTVSAKNAVRQFIEQYLGSNDLMAIVFTGGQADAAQAFTSNKRLLVAAVDKLMGRKLPSVLENLNTPQPCGPAIGRCDPPRDFDSDERLADGRTTMALLRSVAEWFGGVHGRKKMMILVSEGFYYPLENIVDSRSGGRRGLPGDIGRTNVSIYPIDPRGLTTGREDTIDFKKFDGDPAAEARSVQTPLRILAEQTGGVAAIDASGFKGAFDRIVADNSRYYALAYNPPSHPRDGKFHRIEVRVKRPGLTARSRRGYTSFQGDASAPRVTPLPLIAGTLEDALNSPLPLSDIRMRIFAAPFRAPASGLVVFGVELVGGDLTLEPNSPVEISYVAVDRAGKSHGARSDRMVLNVEPGRRASVQETGVRVLNRIDLPPGQYQLRVAAHDPTRRVFGSLVYDLEVPDFDRLPLGMSGLLLMSKSGSAMLTARVDEQIKAMLPAAPDGLRMFPQSDELAVLAEVYDDPRGPAHTIDIITALRSDSDVVVFERAETHESTEQQGGTYRHTMRIPIRNVEPGAYVLSVEAKSNLNGGHVARRVPLTVAPPEPPR